MNSTSLIEWATSAQNATTINIIQNGVGLLFSILIFVRQYDFTGMLESVKAKRLQAKKDKEKRQLEKFRRLLELSKNGEVDIKAVLSEGSSCSEEKVPDNVMKVARKKKRVEV
jgi:hypothetical protein